MNVCIFASRKKAGFIATSNATSVTQCELGGRSGALTSNTCQPIVQVNNRLWLQHT